MKNNIYILDTSTTLSQLKEKLESLKANSENIYLDFKVDSKDVYEDDRVEKIKNNYIEWKKQTEILFENLENVEKSFETSINIKKLKWLDVQVLDNFVDQAKDENWILIVPEDLIKKQYKSVSSLQSSLNNQNNISSNILEAINIEIEKIKSNKQYKEKRDVWERKWENNTVDSYKKQNEREEPNIFSTDAIIDMKDKGYKKLLEIGPGVGRDTQLFVESGLDVTAVEISGSAVERLKQDFPLIDVIHGDVRTFDLNPLLKVDAIYAFSSLHYFDEDETTEIYKKLDSFLIKNGGLYAACRSVNDQMYGKGKEISQDTFIFNGAPRRFFSEETMERQLKGTGFYIEKASERTFSYHKYDKDIKSTFLEIIARKSR